MRSTLHEDVRVSYTVEGQGRPTILVHGLGGSAQTTWGSVVPLLTEDRMVVCPDLRGSGESGAGAMSLDSLAGDVTAVAEDAGLSDYDVAGFSLGAAVAAQHAADRPDRVRRLILVAAPSARPTSRATLQYHLWERLLGHDEKAFALLWLLTGFSERFLSTIPPSQIEDAARFPIEAAAGAQSILASKLDYYEVLERIEAPTLVVSCSDDFINPFDSDVIGALTGCTEVECRELESGHMAVLEAPEALAKAMLAWTG